jgi:cobalamin biosynthesis Co2+ chelatase CbiK
MNPIINYDLIEKIKKVHEPLVEDDAYEIWKHGMTKREQIDVTRLAELCENFTPMDYAVVSIIAIKNYPQIVLKAILDELTKEGES